MAYRKEATGTICAIAAATLLSACWNADKWNVSVPWNAKNPSSEVVTKVDYSPTQTWFALSPFTGSGSEFSFSGGTLYSKGKALTGSLIVETSRLAKGADWTYLWEIPISWPKAVGVPNAAPTEVGKPEKLVFVRWLSKMVLVWERYAYEEKNLKPGETYKFKVFKTGDASYVLEFENKTESKSRDEKYAEFQEKVSEIRRKYAGDAKKINTETRALKESYGIDVRKFQ